MGSGPPTIIRKRGVEDVGEAGGIIAVGRGGNISRARGESGNRLGIWQLTMAEQIGIPDIEEEGGG